MSIEYIDADLITFYKGKSIYVKFHETNKRTKYTHDCITADPRRPGRKLLLFHHRHFQDSPLVVYDEDGNRLAYWSMEYTYANSVNPAPLSGLEDLGGGFVRMGSFILDVEDLLRRSQEADRVYLGAYELWGVEHDYTFKGDGMAYDTDGRAWHIRELCEEVRKRREEAHAMVARESPLTCLDVLRGGRY